MKRRRELTAQFKADAVRMYRESSATLSDVARQLGISPSMLSRWDKEAEAKEKRPAAAPPAEDKGEVARLRRELELVKQERDFLKKAAVSSTGRRNTGSDRGGANGKATSGTH